jgi:hypothetical protein
VNVGFEIFTAVVMRSIMDGVISQKMILFSGIVRLERGSSRAGERVLRSIQR